MTGCVDDCVGTSVLVLGLLVSVGGVGTVVGVTGKGCVRRLIHISRNHSMLKGH